MPALLPCGDRALLVSFASEAEPSSHVLALDRALGGTPGIADLVPGLDSLLVLLDGSRPLAQIRRTLEAALGELGPTGGEASGRDLDIAIRFGGEDGPDLEVVAAGAGLAAEALVHLLTSTPLTVALVGHLPGLPYLRGLPRGLELPRRARPRTAVAAGSLGIAAGMACIYPVRAPGGWHIVGRTEVALVDPRRNPPFLLAPGDRVRLSRAS